MTDMTKKAILFDFDGVLAETMEDLFLAWQKAFLDFGVKIEREGYFPLEGMKLIHIAEKICGEKGIDSKNTQKIVELKNDYYLKNHEFKFYEGVDELIKYLKKTELLLGIISASPRKKLEKTVPKDFLSKFNVVLSGEDSERGKPHPDPYLNGAKKLGVSPENCIVVENAPLGISSAKSAGMYCVAICSTLNKTYLKEADEIVDNIKNLKETNIFKEILNF